MAFTKVVGPGIHTLSNILSHNINSSGIITATQFDGPFSNIVVGGATTLTVDGINISAGILTAQTLDLNGNGDISGNLVIGGNLTANGDFTTLNTTLREVELLRVDANSNLAAGIITQRGSGNILEFFDTSSNVGALTDEGNLGLGSNLTSPNVKLHVKSTATSGGNIAYFDDTGSGNTGRLMILTTGGAATDGVKLQAVNRKYLHFGNATNKLTIDNNNTRIGIGTDIPDTLLHLASSNPLIKLTDYDNGGYSAIGGESGFLYFYTHTSTRDFIFRGSTEVARITGDGMLGIGTHTPTSALHIVKSTPEIRLTNSTTPNEVNSGTIRFTEYTNSYQGTYISYNGNTNILHLGRHPGNDSLDSGDLSALEIQRSDGTVITRGNIIAYDTNSTSNQVRARIKATAANDTARVGAYYGNTEIAALFGKWSGSAFSTGLNIPYEPFVITGASSAVRLTIDTSGHILPGDSGTQNLGSASKEWGNVYLANSKALFLGSNQAGDLYNDGTDTYFRNSASNGQMLLRSNGNILISNYAADEYRIKTFNNGAVELYYDQSAHATAKLATTATGVSVHGEVASSQDYPITKPILDFNFAAEKKLDPRFQFTRESIATFIDKKGIVRYVSNNQPRFDHHPTSGVSLGLLLEREQTNYQEYSTLMSQSNIKNNITVTDNFAISPDGTQNASKIVNSTSNNAQTNIAWNGNTLANNSYAMWSIWVKSEETSCILQFHSNTYIFGSDRVNIELADGTYGGTSASSTFRFNIEKYPNKWWRISVGGNGQGTAGAWYIAVVDSKTAARGATCGSATNKTWFAWGVQEEISTLSRIATSYIPTNGAAVLRKGDRATIDGDDFDDFFDRFQGTVINEHSNAFQSYGGGGSGWEFNNDQFQTNLVNQTGSGYAASSYPGAFANIMGDRGSNGTGSGSGSDYIQAYGPNDADAQNAPANTGNGRYPSGSVVDYTRYYRTWTDAMSYDVTPSENILRVATGGATSYVGGNTQSIALGNISKFELGSDATDMAYSDFCGRIKRWVYYDKLLPFSQLANLTSQLPQSYL